MTATLASTDPVLADFASEVGDTGPVAIAGAKTRWQLGGDLVADTRTLQAPTGIVDYSPDEMTVTVRAGTPVAEVHAALAAKGQRSALPERGGTVGGALAVGENDIRSLGRGMIRTSLLQIRYVSAEGRIVSSGGPTVKNVSGFDLPRLMVGSLGTLGLLAEAIIRTNPIPAVSRWVSAPKADPLAVYDALLAPSAVLWDGSTTWVQLEGHEPDVDAQHRALAPHGTFTEVAAADDGLPEALSGGAMPTNRWSLAPSELPSLASTSTSTSDSTSIPDTASTPDSTSIPDTAGPGRFVAAIGLGLAFGENPQPLRAQSAQQTVIATRLKENFDPTGRLNPGRDPGKK